MELRVVDVETFDRRFFVTKLGWSIFLAVFGLGTYMTTNWLVDRHSHDSVVPSLYFGWERSLPFVPWMIIPYWTMDLFYFFGPMLCTSRRELFTFAKRIVLAFVVACTCFLLWPLREAFIHPPLNGINGELFRLLAVFDRPFNMAPSLHIVEVVLLWAIYSRHTSGWLRRVIQAWFVLIVVSTVLTFQHHTIDVITGLALGLACIRIFPDS